MKRSMSNEHKAALARGRAEGKAVREYLEALRAISPKRGPKRTAHTVQAQLDRIEQELPHAAVVDELLLLQQRRDLQAELEVMNQRVDINALEDAFVKVAASYSEAKGIDYATWREVGVKPAVLKAAGVTRAESEK